MNQCLKDKGQLNKIGIWLFLYPAFLMAAEPVQNSTGMPEELFRALRNSRQNPVTGGAFLKSLPADFRRYYSIMIDTDSNQPASPLRPRIIMTNATGTAQVAVGLENRIQLCGGQDSPLRACELTVY